LTKWEFLQIGYSFGKFHMRYPGFQSLDTSRVCWVRQNPKLVHWLHAGDCFRMGSLEFEVLRFCTGMCAEQGKRSAMEDRAVTFQDLTVSHWCGSSMFGVYDGHSGQDCAHFLHENLHMIFVQTLESKGDFDQSTQALPDVYESIVNSFSVAEQQFLGLARGGMVESGSGSTAVVVHVIGSWICCANVGDSRALLCREGKVVQLSVDHKPDRADERDRIESAGGFIQGGRINHGLAISRSFGDLDCKRPSHDSKPLVVATPELRVENICPEDEFLLLACDGLFNVFDNQEVVDFARSHLAAMNPGEQDPNSTAKDIVNEAINVRGSRDNVTVIIVLLKRCIKTGPAV